MRNIFVSLIVVSAVLLSGCGDNNCPTGVTVNTPSGPINVANEKEAELLKSFIESSKKHDSLNSGEVKTRDVTKGGY